MLKHFITQTNGCHDSVCQPLLDVKAMYLQIPGFQDNAINTFKRESTYSLLSEIRLIAVILRPF